MIADELNEKLGTNLTKRQIDSQPLRMLGMHLVKIRLTMDLIPEISVVVYREGEAPENYMIFAEELAGESPAVEESSNCYRERLRISKLKNLKLKRSLLNRD